MDSSGQASSDYVALLCVIALVLAGAGLAAPDIPRALAHHARVALCIVGGDVCRSSDAARAGYEPCLLGSREKTTRGHLTVMVVRWGQDRVLLTEEHSDGTFTVSSVQGSDSSGTAGTALRLGPVGFQLSGSAGNAWRSGRVWRAGSARERDEIVARLKDPRRGPLPPATQSFMAGGQFLDGEATANGRGARGGGTHWLGRRVGAGLTTWYRDVSAEAAAAFGSMIPGLEGMRRKGWVLEATRDREGRLRGLVLRGTLAREDDELMEIRAPVDLSAPDNRAVARELLGVEKGRLLAALLVLRHRLRPGSIERAVYRTSEERSGFMLGGGRRMPVEAGQEVTVVRRRLLYADVLHPGGGRSRRADCNPQGAGNSP